VNEPTASTSASVIERSAPEATRKPAATGSSARLVSIPANPVPEGAIVGMLRVPDGVALRYARWLPPAIGRKGTVCLFQGRAEFIEKYFEVITELRARGFAVAILDWRGQGLSDRALADVRKGHVRDFDEYGLDLSAFMRDIVLPDCPPPFFALAHSMGASVLLRSLHEGRRWFDRVVLSTPMIELTGLRASRSTKWLARVLNYAGFGMAYVPGGDETVLGLRPFPGNPLTSDPVRYARVTAVLQAEPALCLGSPTVSWASAAYRAMDEFADPAFPASIRQPLLLIAAGRDEIVSTPAIENFAMHLRAGSHLIIPGSRHEIIMEQDRYRAQFWAAFDAFIPGTRMY
jgi:lysophospholipase